MATILIAPAGLADAKEHKDPKPNKGKPDANPGNDNFWTRCNLEFDYYSNQH